MKITLKAEYVVGQARHRPGDTVDIDDIKAEALIDLGYAAVADATREKSTKAKAKPKIEES